MMLSSLSGQRMPENCFGNCKISPKLLCRILDQFWDQFGNLFGPWRPFPSSLFIFTSPFFRLEASQVRIPAHSSYLAPLRRRTGRCPGRRRRGAFKRGVSRNPHLARLKAGKRGGEGGEGGEWRVVLERGRHCDGNAVLLTGVHVFGSLRSTALRRDIFAPPKSTPIRKHTHPNLAFLGQVCLARTKC